MRYYHAWHALTRRPPFQTVTANTGDGWHEYYALNGMRFSSTRDLEPGLEGLDIKCDGGYVVAPPSNHISGRLYEWDAGHHPDETPLMPVPECLVQLLTEKKRVEPTTAQPNDNGNRPRLDGVTPYVHPAPNIKIPIGCSIPDGQRNLTIFSYATALRDRNLTFESVLAILLAINARNCMNADCTRRMPLTDKQVEARVKSAFKAKERFRPCRRPGLYENEGPMRVYRYLLNESGGGWIERSNKEVAAATGMSARNVPRCVKKLEQHSLLEVREGRGRTHRNEYRTVKHDINMTRSPLVIPSPKFAYFGYSHHFCVCGAQMSCSWLNPLNPLNAVNPHKTNSIMSYICHPLF